MKVKRSSLIYVHLQSNWCLRCLSTTMTPQQTQDEKYTQLFVFGSMYSRLVDSRVGTSLGQKFTGTCPNGADLTQRWVTRTDTWTQMDAHYSPADIYQMSVPSWHYTWAEGMQPACSFSVKAAQCYSSTKLKEKAPQVSAHAKYLTPTNAHKTEFICSLFQVQGSAETILRIQAQETNSALLSILFPFHATLPATGLSGTNVHLVQTGKHKGHLTRALQVCREHRPLATVDAISESCFPANTSFETSSKELFHHEVLQWAGKSYKTDLFEGYQYSVLHHHQ